MRSEESTKTAGRITVYGSCVARDAAREMEQRGWSVERYIARQSLISAGRPADVGDLDLSLLRSSFARRSFLSDMVGNLEAQLTAVASYTDLLLWDLTDERLGVLETAPGTFLTRSTEALTAGLYEGLPARFLELGTAEHLHLWRPALLRFHSLLERLDLASRTILINVPWATRTTSGMSTVPSWGQTAMEANWVMTATSTSSARRPTCGSSRFPMSSSWPTTRTAGEPHPSTTPPPCTHGSPKSWRSLRLRATSPRRSELRLVQQAGVRPVEMPASATTSQQPRETHRLAGCV